MTEFLESLPEELRTHPSLKDYKDVGALAKSHVELQKTLGDRPKSWSDLAAPTDAEGRGRAYTSLGRPESPDGYSLPSDGVGVAEFRKAAHESNLTGEQAEVLFGKIAADGKTALDARNAKFAEDMKAQGEKTAEAYKTKWGDKHESEMALVTKAMEKHIPSEALEELRSLGLDNEPWMIDLLNQVGHAMTEDTMFGNMDGGSTSADSLETAAKKRLEMQTNPETQKILGDHMHPDFDRVAKEWQAVSAEEARIATKDGTVPGFGPEAV